MQTEDVKAGKARTIPLTQGKVAIVDAEDYEELSQHKWCANNNHGRTFYAARSVRDSATGKSSTVRMHRAIMNAQPGEQVDHINGNGLDNRKANLRLASHRQNLLNRGPNKNNTSGYKGVSWNKRRNEWVAVIMVDGRSINLGRFDTAEDAARTYDMAALYFFGEYAHTNFEWPRHERRSGAADRSRT